MDHDGPDLNSLRKVAGNFVDAMMIQERRVEIRYIWCTMTETRQHCCLCMKRPILSVIKGGRMNRY